MRATLPVRSRFIARLAGPAAAAAVAAALVAGCSVFGSSGPTPLALPSPTCGGARVEIPGALPCPELVADALAVLRQQAPQQLARGVVSIDVELQGCPANEVPPQLDCSEDTFVQLVTVTFGPAVPGGPIEPSLSVGLSPASGRVLGIVNPLIR